MLYLQKETKKSLTYYDTDKFEFNQSDKRIFQIGKKCYILNYDSYVDEQNVKKFKIFFLSAINLNFLT